MDEETKAAIPGQIREAANKSLPSYSKIAKVEMMKEPFEKTPKKTIKRFLYK
jgi:long-chain acyl-CoA synthetase